MLQARVSPARRRRPATRAALRALATLIALLVGLSSLGQFAHFLLVPHAICAEHGELLELSGGHHGGAHAVHGDEPSSRSHDSAAAEAPGTEHEHCQLLAHGQREQAEPTPATVVVLPAAGAPPPRTLAAIPSLFVGAATLSLAPKTSPPLASVG